MTGPPVRPNAAAARTLLDTHDVVPLVMELDAGDETPVTLMQRLGVDGHCFLLESATAPGGMHGFSFLGHDPVGLAATDSIDPLAPLRPVLEERVAPVAGLEAPFVGGWVGYLGYEAAACYERLPLPATVDPVLPISGFALYRTLIVFDHAHARVLLLTQLRREDGVVDAAHARARARLDALHARITQPRPRVGAVDNPRAIAAPSQDDGHATLGRPVLTDGASTFPREGFLDAVARALGSAT